MVNNSSWRHLFKMHQVSHSVQITVFFPGYWFHQRLPLTFMYTIQSDFKHIQVRLCSTSWTTGAFIIQIAQTKVQSGSIIEHFSAVCGSSQGIVFQFVCTVLVLFIKLIKINIYEGLLFVPSLFGTHLMVIFFNTTILKQPVFLFVCLFFAMFFVLCFCLTLLLNRKVGSWIIYPFESVKEAFCITDFPFEGSDSGQL